ncbi:MAG: hypothetical protein IKE29_12970 [Paenibacillus sp.]|uniref:hypothetical protein n=1 Tax=Paenibacillus sp. TaxID=58172 RepID=UPI0025F92E7D|nr:hypothetical protein [Paenibacillus sp.]MBR2565521.1 hypothetical protein [Paenibacillus sp.]
MSYTHISIIERSKVEIFHQQGKSASAKGHQPYWEVDVRNRREFATAEPDGTIETLFRPDDRMIYWKDQVKPFGGN